MPEDLRLSGTRAVVVNWRDLDHALAGGSERYAWEFAKALVEAGAQVEFLTARDTGQSRADRRDGIVVRRGGGALTFYPWVAWQLFRRRRRLDVVIDPECGIPAFSPLFVARRTAVLLLVHHVHMEQFRTYFSPPMSTLGRFLEGWLMPRVYRRVPTYAVSRSTAEEMRRELGWHGPVGLLENGSGQAGAVRSGPGDPRRVLVLGRLVPHKRVDAVVRAVAQLRQVVPGIHLDVVGRGPDRETVLDLVDSLGLGEVVTVHGFLSEEELDDVLGGCGLHVCASDVEGWGQVVIDAAGHGIPTIGRDVPGLRDSILHGSTGWLVPPAGTDAQPEQLPELLARQVREAIDVLSQPGQQAAYAARCRQWAARFSWERMHEEAVAATVAARSGHRLPVSATRS
jgi:glycosyltransferase involved in cell wall biosynthesis